MELPNSPLYLENLNPVYQDRYFSDGDGLAETRLVFLAGNDLPGAISGRRQFHIGETGFGTGLNLLALAESLPPEVRDCAIHWWSVEKFPLAAGRMRALLASFAAIAPWLEAHLQAWAGRSVNFGWFDYYLAPAVHVHVWLGDVLEMLESLPAALREAGTAPTGIDAWILDGHSPALNPDMWSPAVFGLMASASHPADPARGIGASSLATYTAAGLVKSGLRQAGFTVRRFPGYGAKRHMVRAWFGQV